MQGIFAIQLVLIICVVGLISSAVWFLVFGRARAWIAYYSEHAKAVEEKLEKLTKAEATPNIFRGMDGYYQSGERKFYEKHSITRTAIWVPVIFFIMWIVLIGFFASILLLQTN